MLQHYTERAHCRHRLCYAGLGLRDATRVQHGSSDKILTAESLLLVQVHAVVTFPRHRPPSLQRFAPFCAAVLDVESITKTAIRPSWCCRCLMAAVIARLRANLGQHNLLLTHSSIGECTRCLEDLLRQATGRRGAARAGKLWCCNAKWR